MAYKQKDGFLHFAKTVALSGFKAMTGNAEELLARRARKAALEGANAFVERVFADNISVQELSRLTLKELSRRSALVSVKKGIARALAAKAMAQVMGEEDPLSGCRSFKEVSDRALESSIGSALRPARLAFGEVFNSKVFCELFGLNSKEPGGKWRGVVANIRLDMHHISFDAMRFDQFLDEAQACAALAQRELIAVGIGDEKVAAKPKARSL